MGIKPSWEPWAFGVVVLFLVAFGGLVLQRSAFSDRRRTDAGVFFRAGYAVRSGIDPYAIPDNNDWYYLYPPGFAAVFVPLADPPRASPAGQVHDVSQALRGWFIPYPVSIAIWYALSVACIGVCVYCISRALEEGSPDPAIRGIRPAYGGWWNIRFWPLVMCLPDFGSTLSKGQVNIQVLACICIATLMTVRARRAWAGAWLAAAACIKVFPGLLVFYPLARRERRGLAGYAACGVALMIAFPAIVYGPSKAWEYTWEFADRVVLAGLRGDERVLQAGSAFENTDNLSIQGSLHNLLNLATPRGERPNKPEAWIKPVHIGVSLSLLVATLAVGRIRGEQTGLEVVLRIGMLCCVMLLAVPMCHRHYYVFVFPAVAALVFAHIGRSPLGTVHGWGWLLVPAYAVLQGLPRFEQEGLLRDLPIPLVVNLAVWGMCWRVTRHERTTRATK